MTNCMTLSMVSKYSIVLVDLLQLLLLWNSSVWLQWNFDHEGDALCVRKNKVKLYNTDCNLFQYFTSYFLSSNL